MKTVLAFGCFDILHYGHLQYLRKAKELGDRLVVVVARDSTMKKVKGREPIFDEKARLEMVKALRLVDDARLGNEDGEKEKYAVILEVKPDVIALGYDQAENEARLKEWLHANGLSNIEVKRIKHAEDAEVYKSSKAIEKIRSCIIKEL